MQKRISAVILLIAFLALIVLLTVNGIRAARNMKKNSDIGRGGMKKVNIVQKQVKKSVVFISRLCYNSLRNQKRKGV